MARSFQLIGPGDLDRVAAAMDHNQPGTGARLLGRARWLLTDNPWRGERPLGVQLVSEGEISGYCFGVAQPLWVAGQERPGWFGMGLYLDPALRGSMLGTSLYASFFRLGAGALAATTSGNTTSNALWTGLGASAPPGGELALVRPLRPWRLLPAALERRLRGAAPDRRPAAWTPAPTPERALRGGWRSRPTTDWPALAALWRAVRPAYPLATDRTEAWLAWRYGPDAPPAVVVELLDAAGAVRGFYALRIASRGGRARVATALLLDLVVDPADVDALAALAADFDARCWQHGADVAEVRGLRLDLRAAFRRRGYLPRPLDTNSFLVRAADGPLQPQPGWHLVPADGDAGFW